MSKATSGATSKLKVAYTGNIVPRDFCKNWTQTRRYHIKITTLGLRSEVLFLSVEDRIVTTLLTDLPSGHSIEKAFTSAQLTIRNILNRTIAAQSMLSNYPIGLTDGEWFCFQDDEPILIHMPMPQLPIAQPTETTPWKAVKIAMKMLNQSTLEYAIRDFQDGVRLRQGILESARLVLTPKSWTVESCEIWLSAGKVC